MIHCVYAVVGKTLRMESVMFSPLQHINSNNCMHMTHNNGTVKRTVNHDCWQHGGSSIAADHGNEITEFKHGPFLSLSTPNTS